MHIFHTFLLSCCWLGDRNGTQPTSNPLGMAVNWSEWEKGTAQRTMWVWRVLVCPVRMLRIRMTGDLRVKGQPAKAGWLGKWPLKWVHVCAPIFPGVTPCLEGPQKLTSAICCTRTFYRMDAFPVTNQQCQSTVENKRPKSKFVMTKYFSKNHQLNKIVVH